MNEVKGGKQVSLTWLILIQWVLAFEWLHSGWGKWSDSGFMTNIGKTLTGFAAKTPYTSYGSFLQNTAIPNAELFGNLIRTSEILIGIALVIAGIIYFSQKRFPIWFTWLLIIALLGGALMNLNFFLASGWSSPSTWGVNLIMGAIELILAIYYISKRNSLI